MVMSEEDPVNARVEVFYDGDLWLPGYISSIVSTDATVTVRTDEGFELVRSRDLVRPCNYLAQILLGKES